MPVVEVLTRQHMDQLTCANPSCTHEDHKILVLNSQCHRGNAQRAHYFADGVLEIRCHVCNRRVLLVAIAAEDQVVLDPFTRCGDPECKHPVGAHSCTLEPPCHKRSGILVEYRDGYLSFRCGGCRKAFSVIDDRGLQVQTAAGNA